MKALVLEKKLELSLRDIAIPTITGDDEVKIKMVDYFKNRFVGFKD